MNFTNTDSVNSKAYWQMTRFWGKWQVRWQMMAEGSEVKWGVHEQIVPLKSKIKLEIKI